jgi:hypothetical protein
MARDETKSLAQDAKLRGSSSQGASRVHAYVVPPVGPFGGVTHIAQETAPISDVGQGRFGGSNAVYVVSGRTCIILVHSNIASSINFTPLALWDGWRCWQYSPAMILAAADLPCARAREFTTRHDRATGEVIRHLTQSIGGSVPGSTTIVLGLASSHDPDCLTGRFRSSEMSTKPHICPSCECGFARPGCGWRGCSIRRSLISRPGCGGWPVRANPHAEVEGCGEVCSV